MQIVLYQTYKLFFLTRELYYIKHANGVISNIRLVIFTMRIPLHQTCKLCYIKHANFLI